ncbi:TonB-dependent receptor plug domain-containing protein, partial [Nitrosomonas sp.]|uniref:TonB-dependent receptor plug domain-containing protein n=1 Tax=Nitrosomonas sp. TaxID=42353 RepID=UPI0025EA87C3
MAFLIENGNVYLFFQLSRLVRARVELKQIRLKTLILRCLICVILCCFTRNAVANSMFDNHQLLDLNIEELMNIEVTTVSRRSQKLTDVASAIFVITGDDIRRSGATSIPDALRMAPGVQVARVGT